MTDAEVEREIDKSDSIKRQLQRQQKVLAAVVMAMVLIPLFVTWQIDLRTPSINNIRLTNVVAQSATDLCPGDKLIIAYDFYAEGEGVLIKDWTSWKIDPPKTVIFSISRRFIIGGPLTQHLVEAWTVPANYFNYETELFEPMPSGQYRRYIAVSSPAGGTAITIAGVDYSIREDCP